MRIRTYDSRIGVPCFFEIKHKKNGIVRKYRATVKNENWRELFETPGCRLEEIVDDENMENAGLFYQTALAYQAGPKILTRYRRKAFVSDVDDYARATFDRQLCYQRIDGYELILDESRMVSYDNETLFDPECNVVLELKSPACLTPLWMLDLIRHFDLRRGRFSKYLASVNEAIQGDFAEDRLDRFLPG